MKHLITSLGNINSPNYPKNYPDDILCGSIIRVGIGERIRLVFLSFDVDRGGTNIYW